MPDNPVPRSPARARFPVVAATLGYTALALVITSPLVYSLSSSFPHDNLDPGFVAWLLRWNAYHLPFSAAWWNAPFFYPLAGATALSEHLVGISLLTTPLLWLGATPALAHNIALLLSFVLSALFAALLVMRLTGRADAAVLAGLAFGFAPYRVSQLPHLQVLTSWGMPLALLGLHRYASEGRIRWLVLFALSWLVQALSNGYYLFFFSILLPLWIAWFVPWRDVRKWGAILGAWAIAAAPLAPMLLTYVEVQRRQGFERNLGEMAVFSARLDSAVLASPMLAIWHRWLPAGPGEAQLFPGMTLAVLLAAGALVAWRHPIVEPSAGWRRTRRALFILAAGLALVAATTLVRPWQLGGVSISRLDRPLGLALVLAASGLLIVPRVRQAWTRRSVFGFYVVAACMLAVFSLGPAPSIGGTAIWYKAPYAWLLQVPGFNGLRVPARFAMPILLCLSIVAATVFARLVPRGSRARPVLAALVALGLVADTWTVSIPLAPMAGPLALPTAIPADAVVLEMPFGDHATDIEAIAHAQGHGHPVVNGYSGYTPAHTLVLAAGLDSGDHDVLRALSAWAPIAVIVNRRRDGDRRWRAFMAAQPAARLIASDADRDTYLVARTPAVPAPPAGPPVPVVGATANVHSAAVVLAIDGRPDTAWRGAFLDAGDEALRLDLGRPSTIAGVTLRQRVVDGNLPRYLTIETAQEPDGWRVAWEGLTCGRYLPGAILNPLDESVPFVFAPTSARYVRLRVRRDQRHPWTWSIAEITVHAPAP